MRLGEPAKMQSSINVTPLVDVVLVLLIIFMVVAPNMRPGPEVDVPTTARPHEQGDARDRILVTIDQDGGLWIDDQAVPSGQFTDGLRAAAGAKSISKVVIQGDARLRFGEVRQAMLAIEDAGFNGVALISKKANATAGD